MAIIPIRREDSVPSVLRMPAEWEPQSAVMLTWPHPYGDWAPTLAAAFMTFAEIAAHISHHQKVLITALDAVQRDHIETALIAQGAHLDRVSFFTAPSNDVFVRDHGPLTVETKEGYLLLDFRFNGWGNKYPSTDDNGLTQILAHQGAFGHHRVQENDFVLEGGSIDSDGAGTLLVTASCLLNPSRNPKLSREDIESTLKTWLGATRILWLQHGYLAGDDTDGHVDTLARFCDRDTIAYCACPHPNDEHYSELKKLEDELRTLRTIDDVPYRLVALPWPTAKLNADGERLPATYANFLIINDAVLVPTYADRADAQALRLLQGCFPDRTIIGIPCNTLIAQHGSLHCATMQLPKGIMP